MKADRAGDYSERVAGLCERTLVTLLRGCGPWKRGLYLAGGLVPRYLPRDPKAGEVPHVGTWDVDLVLDLDAFQDLEAYRTLERNLKKLGFERGRNEEGQARHFAWERRVEGVTIVVDLLSARPGAAPGRPFRLPGERRLSALHMPGAHLVLEDHLEVLVTADLLDDAGAATETVRVANRVPFLVLKALAYDDRFEKKDAYDIVWSLVHARGGPEAVGREFAETLRTHPEEPLLGQALDVLRRRFLDEPGLPGLRKDGPTSYALFLSGDGPPLLRHREEAVLMVQAFVARAEGGLG